jgi:hypothetical protein
MRWAATALGIAIAVAKFVKLAAKVPARGSAGGHSFREPISSSGPR